MYFNFTLDEIKTRGGILDKLLDTAFDAAIIIDKNGYIIHCSEGSVKLTNISLDSAIGKHISILDAESPFEHVLKTGKPETGIMVVLNGRKCMTNLIPIISNGEIIGLIGMVLFQNLNTLKNILKNITKQTQSEFTNINDIVARVDSNYTFDDYIGENHMIEDMLEECKRAARTIFPVLIIGETGTGKEILANGFHSEGMESFSPFIKINCTAIPDELLESELFGYEKGAFTGAVSTKKGKFELASGGSILLDEIGDMNLRLQSKLLRVLEERVYERIGGNKLLPLNARVIASTNKDLKELCKEGKFRQDLYYRLNTIEIKVPPLRDRKDDIPLLIEHFIHQNNLNVSFSNEALEIFFKYNWPGNIRELRNVVNRLSVNYSKKEIKPEHLQQVIKDYFNLSSTLTDENLFQPQTSSTSLESSFESHEKELLMNTLQNCNYNISNAAKQLKVCRSTLYNKIRKYNLTLIKKI
ncbi:MULTISPECIES: sigma-54 interaction domain-containing protein [Clostridium]|uniref:sigma-54 interaction domain-containing protein n=1 Tax=Clostridium TaxID=1485 RepID=UPI000983F709|nr:MULTISPECIES: sigma 54-interacting transcriptional regulator [Clostridium]AQR97472.1 arginine utilization regulatory protein RocR [Clostridium saccharoperbutylacetonicum]NSB33356.1 transcriptional regulator with PAS, ATPase and Fis domain [Clostridium saccharoperbutylacetonicum]